MKICENEGGWFWRGLGVLGVAMKGSWGCARVGEGEEEQGGG